MPPRARSPPFRVMSGLRVREAVHKSADRRPEEDNAPAEDALKTSPFSKRERRKAGCTARESARP